MAAHVNIEAYTLYTIHIYIYTHTSVRNTLNNTKVRRTFFKFLDTPSLFIS
jgi:hypothetical protein